MSTVTMKDIARALRVSVMTVSKVIRDRAGVAAKTRERVLQKALELGYRPNLTARSLVTGQSFQVGIIVPTLLHPFWAEVLEALSSTFQQRGYAVMISSSLENPVIEEAAIEQHLAHRLDGLIIASCNSSPAKFQQLTEQKIPFVLIDRFFPGFKANFVGVDDVAVGRIATEHLIEMGCKRIAHIRGLEFTTGIGRFEGYKLALKRHRMSFDSRLVSPYVTADGKDWQQSYDAMRGLLKAERIDGVFCYNDPIAYAAIEVVLEAGLRIPAEARIEIPAVCAAMPASRRRIERRLLQRCRAEAVRRACCSDKRSGEYSEAAWPSEDPLDVLRRTLGPRAHNQLQV